MKRKQKMLYGAAAALLYLAIWEGAARWLNLPFAVPTIGSTLQALGRMIGTLLFWQTIGTSLLRIISGLLLGTVFGIALAALSVKSDFACALISPAQTIIRCTPVASFIMILWILVGRDTVPGAIAVLMVCPVIWRSLLDGYAELDRPLEEVLTVFRATRWKRFLLLVLPGLRAPFLTAFTTSAGLAWKAGIAAEIIAYSANSIGRQIADARNMFDGAEMMAWTLCVIAMSLALEKIIAQVALRWGKGTK